ncbi:hypothetical protein [uncultured Helicobacter sp.]|uniref:hypothetical protein n=1 Tax=uncultured Helicobacter sp. TaxID=175537 RepID=UPI00260266C2|nr:hypothetical protein [uncultured Helicobacter sp.]
MESFKNKEIIFYTLILNEKENQKLQESPEILEDFLEDKICSLLNLPHTCEYFLRFSHTQDSTTYHCLLLNKDSLKKYVSDANLYLSHPCFLCAQFLRDDRESQAFLVLDSYAQWTLIYYERGEIAFLQPIKDFQVAQEKIKDFRQKDKNFLLTFWVLDESSATQEIQHLQSQFNAQRLSYKINEIELLDSLNFNPLEKTLPLMQQKIGKALKFSVLGVLMGIGIWLVFLILNLLSSREIANLQSQIHEQHIKINDQNQSFTESQKQALLLQEQRDSLQMLYEKNSQFLKNAMPNATYLVPFFNAIDPILQEQNVKIAYFGMENNLLSLLFRGKNTLQVLEELEKSHWGNVQSLEKYQDFYWIQIAMRIPR